MKITFFRIWSVLYVFFNALPLGFAHSYVHVIIDSSEDRPVKPYIKELGDINGDGMIDILVASAKGKGAFWYEAPKWIRHSIVSEGTFSEEGQLADIDGDGDLDAILPTPDGIFWFENALAEKPEGFAPWQPHFIGSDGSNVHDLSVADLDNDGDLEVIVRYEKELRRPLTIWWQSAPLEWKPEAVSSHFGEGLAVGDVNNDGFKDLVINEICLMKDRDSNEWNAFRFTEGMPDQLKVVCADLNADGQVEIIVSPQSYVPEGRIGKIACFFFQSDGGTPRWSQVILEEGAAEVNKVHGIAVDDMDHDGDLDITTSKRHDAKGTVEIAIFQNLDGSARKWNKSVITTMGSHNHQVADINGDGYPDIVGANWNDEALVEAWITHRGE